MRDRFPFAIRCTTAFAMLLLALPHAVRAQDVRTADIVDAVVGIRADVPITARTASTLGTTREGSGVVIDSDGLVLTIGYLIVEAGVVEVIDAAGRTIPADIVAYDAESGFGLVRALQGLSGQPLTLGTAAGLRQFDRALVASRAGGLAVQPAMIAARREFAGYWEYLLDDAIFTVPAHAEFGGAALIDREGRLVGVGSLFVGDAVGDGTGIPGNMFVPVDLLQPILADLLASGRPATPPHPWLGLFAAADTGGIRIARVAEGGPAAKAGLRSGDLITAVAGAPIGDLADFYRRLWGLGPAGVDVPLTLRREAGENEIVVRSRDRYEWLRLNPTY
jgi:S1-C subfamily serine protease